MDMPIEKIVAATNLTHEEVEILRNIESPSLIVRN